MHYTLMFYLGPEEFVARTDPGKKDAFWAAFLPYAKALVNAGIVVVLALFGRSNCAASIH
jgi:hypothetical protein